MKFLLSFIIVFLLFTQIASAQGAPPPGPAAGGAAMAVPTYSIPNFLGITDPNDLIARIIKVIIGLSGTFALVVFIWGGVLWLISRGEADMIKKGKSAMTYAALGLIIIFSSYIIVNQLLNILMAR